MKMDFNLAETPYSIRGSDLSLIDEGGLKLHSAIQQGGTVFAEINFYKNGRKVHPQYTVETDLLTATLGSSKCEICFFGKGAMAIRNRGFDIFIIPYLCDDDNTYSVKHADGHLYTVACYGGHYFASYYFVNGAGEFAPKYKPIINLPFLRPKAKNCVRIKGDADFFFGLSDEQIKFSDVAFDIPSMRKKTEDNWQDFLSKMPSVPEKYKEFAKMTWFTIWSNMVPKSRHYVDDTVLMGKVGMPAIWSWDHCFNALSTDYYNFETAWKQFSLPFMYQFDNGSLPDAFSNSHFFIGIMKPPIHGWCFMKLMDRHPDISTEILERAYGYLTKQFGFWMDYRDSDGDGLPDYPQGCDSGLDNGTVFLDVKDRRFKRRFVECPDLPSYLILECDAIMKIGKKLGKDTSIYAQKRAALLSGLISHFGRENGFVSMHTYSHEVNPNAHCIIDLLPLVLGDDLPKEWQKKTIDKLKKESLTQYGVASEAAGSIYYRPDGYWQGPIWAPTTYLLVDGLRRMGEKALAKDITERYLNMVVNIAKGNYENYDALSGKGLCVKGHTWTASVTILLMHELVTEY